MLKEVRHIVTQLGVSDLVEVALDEHFEQLLKVPRLIRLVLDAQTL